MHQVTPTSSDVVFDGRLLTSRQVSPTIPGEPYTESDEEWIELYNRGSQPVDLSGWTLEGGVRYEMPAGTMIGAGEYLVIANDAVALRAKHPTANILGNFSGRLNDKQDEIILRDAANNPADEVHYYDGGRWAEYADGGGSSLELRDPRADNSLPESWEASLEADQSQWQTYTYRQVAAPDAGPPNVWNEFVMGMLDEGEVLLDDIHVFIDPGPNQVELLQNGSFDNDELGEQPDHWRIIGNHEGQVVLDPDEPQNQVLHLRALGPTEHVHNHAETTFRLNQSIVLGRTYEISYRAKWLGGSRLLNSRAYLALFASSIPLDVPQATGTPGAQNSVFVANSGPSLDALSHFPATPTSSERVAVSVRADDPDGVASMILKWSVERRKLH